MLNLRTISLITILSLVAGPVLAAGFDIKKERPSVFGYTYVEGGMVKYNDYNLDGYFIDGSVAVAHNWAVTALYTSYSGDDVYTNNDSVDVTNLQLGGVYHFKWFFTDPKRSHYLLRDLDLIALAGFEQTKTETEVTINIPGFPSQTQTSSDTESGTFAGVKARKKMVPQVEVAAGLTFHTHYDGIFVFSIEGLYEVIPNLHLRLSSEHYDNDPYVNFFDDDTIAFSVRYDF